jgi:hypothetical protein
MANLKKFTVSKNKQKGGWDLRQNGVSTPKKKTIEK